MTNITKQQYILLTLKNDDHIKNLIKHDKQYITDTHIRFSLFIEMINNYFLSNDDHIIQIKNIFTYENVIYGIYEVYNYDNKKNPIMYINIQCKIWHKNNQLKSLYQISHDIDNNISITYFTAL
jgi:hypothetical protein